MITAILVVAIAATIASYLAFGQQVWLRQAQNLADRAQAESLHTAALNWIALILARDAKDNKIDHLGEVWSKQFPPLPFEDATIAIAISDAQARFNLNNLVRDGAPNATDIGVFQRLLLALSLDPNLTDALVDWLDPDSQARPAGAEDIDYLNTSLPYRASNQPLASVGELRLAKGFSVEAIEKLTPHVAALPEPTPVNVNTAPATILAVLFPELPQSAIQQILNTREQQPFTAPGDLLNLLPPGQPAPQSAYGVNTSYFLVTIEIRIGRLTWRTESLLHRPVDSKPVNVVWQRQQYLRPIHETATDETPQAL